jgi:hypothetical protein
MTEEDEVLEHIHMLTDRAARRATEAEIGHSLLRSYIAMPTNVNLRRLTMWLQDYQDKRIARCSR